MSTSDAELVRLAAEESEKRAKKFPPVDDLKLEEKGDKFVGTFVDFKECRPSEKYPESVSYMFFFDNVEGHTNRCRYYSGNNLLKQLPSTRFGDRVCVLYDGKKTASTNGHTYRDHIVSPPLKVA